MDYNIKDVTSKADLDKLYKHSAFTIEGLAQESVPEMVDWLTETTTFTVEKPTVYVISDAIMNAVYALTGNNAYAADLTIVSVFEVDLASLVFKRFDVGGRWFDDVVDNNTRREAESVGTF